MWKSISRQAGSKSEQRHVSCNRITWSLQSPGRVTNKVADIIYTTYTNLALFRDLYVLYNNTVSVVSLNHFRSCLAYTCLNKMRMRGLDIPMVQPILKWLPSFNWYLFLIQTCLRIKMHKLLQNEWYSWKSPTGEQ